MKIFMKNNEEMTLTPNDRYHITDEQAEELRTNCSGNPLYDIREDGSVWQYEIKDLLERIIILEKALGIKPQITEEK